MCATFRTLPEHLHGVDLCLMMDQVGELITCPIHEGDGAKEECAWQHRIENLTASRETDTTPRAKPTSPDATHPNNKPPE
jgi:hypothetical protein